MAEDRIRVLARVSRPQADGAWETREAEHETLRPSGVTVEDAVRSELEVLERSLRASLPPGLQPTIQPDPQVNPAELERLEWRLYKPPHSAGWIFADKAPRTLIEQLENGPVTLDKFSYKFSGPEEKPRLFVSRAPVKE